jgi:hypothetical protein
MKKNDEMKKCKRCNRQNSKEIICQSCKTELLSNFEASADWQIAYEIEVVQLATSRYYNNEEYFDIL